MSANTRYKPICNAFSVDVEDYFHVSAYSRVIARRDWDSFPSRVEANTQAMMEVLAEADVKGTFFVLGWVAERFPGLVSEIAAQGHEIACHGYSHKLIYRQSRQQFTEEAHRAKSLLEDISGAAVNGYRGASFSITRESLWALEALAELGFTFDSSIYPIRHDRYGIPGAPTRPFAFRCESGATINDDATSCGADLTLPTLGGPNSLSGNKDIEIDTTAPVVTVVFLATNDTTPELTGTVNDTVATIFVTVDGNGYAATNNADGTWKLADDTISPALAVATYDVAVTATDAAGNVGSDGTTDELTITP